jgi:hypothetical protein
MPAAPPLRLLAEDADDLAVLSAALQDAVAKVGDIVWEPRGRLLTIGFNRYLWEGGARRRVRCGLQLAAVLSVKSRNIRRSPANAVVELLTMEFTPADAPPGGTITFTFAGDGDLVVSVECIDAVLADVSATWPTPRTPAHES